MMKIIHYTDLLNGLIYSMIEYDSKNFDTKTSKLCVISSKHDGTSLHLMKIIQIFVLFSSKAKNLIEIIQMLGVFSTNHYEISSTHIGFSTNF